LLLGVHHERAVLGDRLTQRTSRDQQQPGGQVTGIDDHAVGLRIVGEYAHPLQRHRLSPIDTAPQ
jgi:hypothetical protein